MRRLSVALALSAVASPSDLIAHPGDYAWLSSIAQPARLDHRIPPPTGFHREAAPQGGFAAWLRGLPLKPDRPPVRLFDGRLKANQEAHHAVVDIDVGTRDLQQCADAVIRLRTEYLYASGAIDRARFEVTNGAPASLAGWFGGDRPLLRRGALAWTRTARPESSYASARRFLDVVFTYAGSASLARQWYEQDAADSLATPAWTFGAGALRRFP